MRFISRRTHGALDYIVGLLLIFSPKIFDFNWGGPAVAVPVTLGVLTLAYSLATNYEWGMFRFLPFRTHLTIDALSGIFLAASPWLLGFADDVWKPHLAFGLLEIGAVMMTRRENYHAPDPAARQPAHGVR